MWIAIHAFVLTFVTLTKLALMILGTLAGVAACALVWVGLVVSLSSGDAPLGL